MSSTSRGLDVSSYQGPQDWPGLAKSGLTFAFAKASEGQRTRDARFDTHMPGIIKAGLVPGAYHYAWPSQDPILEAANYVAAVRPYARRGFIHVLDLERRSDGANYASRSATQIRAWASAWIAAVAKAFPGQRVGIYTSGDDITAGHLPGNAAFLWYPAYPSGAMTYEQAEARTRPAPGGLHPLFWQFTSTPVDRNVAYLDPAALRDWALGDDTTPQEDPMSLTDADIDKIAARSAAKLLAALLPSPTAKPGTDPNRPVAAYLRYGDAHHAEVMAQVDAVRSMVAAQTAAIKALAAQLGEDVDTDTVVAAVQKAISEAVVHVDVNVTGPAAG
jgi:GH25 family lysozyme M1 (1,4-beta-N-acetylmuramidase)